MTPCPLTCNPHEGMPWGTVRPWASLPQGQFCDLTVLWHRWVTVKCGLNLPLDLILAIHSVSVVHCVIEHAVGMSRFC